MQPTQAIYVGHIHARNEAGKDLAQAFQRITQKVYGWPVRAEDAEAMLERLTAANVDPEKLDELGLYVSTQFIEVRI